MRSTARVLLLGKPAVLLVALLLAVAAAGSKAAAKVPGPATAGIWLDPLISRGDVDVRVWASGVSQGESTDVIAGEFLIDVDPDNPPAPGSGWAMTLDRQAPVATMTAIIPAAVMQMLGEGAHVLSVRSQDARLEWGTCATATLGIDWTGPDVTGASAYPNPNNGQQGVSSVTPAVRVHATVSDRLAGGGGGVRSAIVAVEGFVDAAGDPGTGFSFLPLDGEFDFFSEQAYALVPLTIIDQLPPGPHPIYVRGQDMAGNWGDPATTTLILDKAASVGGSAATIPQPGAVPADGRYPGHNPVSR